MISFFRISHFITDTVFYRLLGLKVKHGERLTAWRGGIVASNHASYLDPPLVGNLFYQPIHYLAKSELFRIPLLGFLIRRLNAMPIRRGAIDRAAMERVMDKIRAGETVLIFPEGSRRNFTAKPGIGKIARQMACPILPVFVENSNHWLACLLRRKKLRMIIGEAIPAETVAGFADDKQGYRSLAELILEKIYALKDAD